MYGTWDIGNGIQDNTGTSGTQDTDNGIQDMDKMLKVLNTEALSCKGQTMRKNSLSVKSSTYIQKEQNCENNT